MTPEINAKSILKLLRIKVGGPTEPIRNAQLQSWCTEAGIDANEQTAALEYAGDQGWINQSDGWTALTPEGWESGL